MAIKPNIAFPGRITAPDANYPYGSSKDESAPGAGDGTPYKKIRADDVFGFQQSLLTRAGVIPSGNADTALVSDYLDSCFLLFGYAAVASVFDLLQIENPTDGMVVDVNSFYTNVGVILGNGGGSVYWKADQDQSTANGITIIDPANIGGWNGTQADLTDFLDAQGSGGGTGCWIRIGSGIDLYMCGGVTSLTLDNTRAFEGYKDLNAVTPYKLLIPAGHFRCNTVDWTSSINIKGVGAERSIIEPIQASGQSCWIISEVQSRIRMLSMRRDVAVRDEGTAIETRASKFDLSDIEFHFNEYGLRGTFHHFYMTYTRVNFDHDSKMLIDDTSNNNQMVSFRDCSWQNGFTVHGGNMILFQTCDFSANPSLGTQPYKFLDPISLVISGGYLENNDTAGAGPLDIMLFQDTVGGERLNVDIRGVWVKGVSGKTETAFVFDGVQGTVRGGYVGQTDYIVKTLNGGTAVVDQVHRQASTAAFFPGSDVTVLDPASFLLGGDGSPIANQVNASAYKTGSMEINNGSIGLSTPIARTGKSVTSGFHQHYDMYSGTTLAGALGIDGNTNVQIESFSGTLRLVSSTYTDMRVNNSLKARFDDSSSAGETALLLYDVDNDNLERVTVGSADSGGAGYKVLRIPN